MVNSLPIYDLKEQFIKALRAGNQVIISAPPGSGKSTHVPQFIADGVISAAQKVIVLQPRRMATRMLSAYIATQRNTKLGDEVGYQIRLEANFSAHTRILFLTEGVLLKKLLNNGLSDDIAAIVFDEFHERHAETDLTLVLARMLQERYRPDLKIIIMSATLTVEPLLRYLPKATHFETSGRLYPVSVNYVPPQRSQPIWEAAANQAAQAIKSLPNGSVLVFMPGAYEINRTIAELSKKDLGHGISIYPLHGSLSKQEQDEAIKPGGRKIIVSTNVAETSLTIPNIAVVIDGGQVRVSRYDASRGIQTLFTEPISQASSHQRAGRAGRTQDGACIRLWSEFEQKHRKPNQQPEIHRIDLSEILLALIALAKTDLNTFAWFEQPEQFAIDKSLALLRKLGALTSNNQPTEIGEKMATIGTHPRIAKLLLKAQELGCLPSASVLAALVQGQAILFPTNDEQLKILRESTFGNEESDLLMEYNAWLYAAQTNYKPEHCSRLGINTVVAKQIEALAYQYLNHFFAYKPQSTKVLQNKLSWDDIVKLKKCILAAFADFVAIKHRPKSSTCSMIGGLSGQLHADSTVQSSKLLVATELEETKTATGVLVQLKKVTAIDEDWLKEMVGTAVSFKRTIVLDPTLKRVVEVLEEYLDDLLINSKVSETSDDDAAAEVLTQAILTNEIPFEQWDEQVEHFVRRLNFAAIHAPEYGLPQIDSQAKAFIIQQSIYGCRSIKDVQKTKLWPALNDWLRYEQRQAVELVAPESIELPHRKRPVKLRYDEKGDVILSETIQALYDCPLPITVAEGRVKVVFELLSPARRPVQITRDLDYFWKNSYLEIRKELKGRYPKHEWR